MDQFEIIIMIEKKNKKFNLNDKIKNYKKFDKKTKKKIKKLKVERRNQNILYK
jgi:hypothetical protein